jgi:hypothetical protein
MITGIAGAFAPHGVYDCFLSLVRLIYQFHNTVGFISPSPALLYSKEMEVRPEL